MLTAPSLCGGTERGKTMPPPGAQRGNGMGGEGSVRMRPMRPAGRDAGLWKGFVRAMIKG